MCLQLFINLFTIVYDYLHIVYDLFTNPIYYLH